MCLEGSVKKQILVFVNCCVRDNFGDVQVIHYRRDKVTMKLLAVALAALQLLPAISLAQNSPALDGRLKKIHDTQSIAIAHRTDAAPFSF
jgi:hypothetical protein